MSAVSLANDNHLFAGTFTFDEGDEAPLRELAGQIETAIRERGWAA